MSKIVWISCKQVVEYKQQVTLTDEEYEEVKDFQMGDDIIPGDDGYDVIEDHINLSDVLDVDQEFTDVQVTTQEYEEEKEKKRLANRKKVTNNR